MRIAGRTGGDGPLRARDLRLWFYDSALRRMPKIKDARYAVRVASRPVADAVSIEIIMSVLLS